MASALKRCGTCGVEKPLTEFYKNKRLPQGVAGSCKVCRRRLDNQAREARGLRARKPLKRYDDPPGFKTCRKCMVRKPVSEFGRNPRVTDGLQPYCRPCANAPTAARRRAASAERRAAKAASAPPAGYKRCPECKEVLPLSAFHKNKARPDGVGSYCGLCALARNGHVPRYVDPAPEGSKTCRTCNEVKPLTDFYRDERAQRGVAATCRACRDAKDTLSRRARGIRERPQFTDPEGYKTCRRCREQKLLGDFRVDKRNRDGRSAWCADCQNERTLQWHRDNPAVIMAIRVRRQMREEAGALDVSDRDLRRLIERWDGRCAYCGEVAERMHLDHVVPLSKGGRHTIGNLLPACETCNTSKGAKLLVEWRRWQGERRSPKPLSTSQAL